MVESQRWVQGQWQQPKREKRSKCWFNCKFVTWSTARGVPEPGWGPWPAGDQRWQWWCWGPAVMLSSAPLFLSLRARRLLSISQPSAAPGVGRAAPAAGCRGGRRHCWQGTGPTRPGKKAPLLWRGFGYSHYLRPTETSGEDGKTKQINFVSQRAFTTARACTELCSNIHPEVRTAQALNSQSAPADRLIPGGIDSSPATRESSVLRRLSAQ